jgi:hypothetical protein
VTDFDDMHSALFETFGVDGSVMRGAGPAVPVLVVIDEGQEMLGDHGQSVGQVTVAKFRVAQFRPRSSDLLTVGTETRTVQKVIRDDGYVAEAVLYG